jgi:hypothetical protein
MKFFYITLFILASLTVSAATPTVPASNLSFNIIEGSFFNISWTAGNGTRRVVIAKAGSPVTAVPQNGIDYTENTNFGSGQAMAPGEYVVYDNAFTSYYLTGLTPGTQYYFAVFEYNGTGVNTEYLTSSFLTGNGFTPGTPTIQTSNAAFSTVTATSVTVTWTSGNGYRRLIVAREATPVTSDPVNLHNYSGSNSFGSGAQVGAGNYSVYTNTGNSTTINNLRPGTQYYLSFYEYNGNSEPVYLGPAYTATVTTRTIPTVAASDLVTIKTDGKELAFNWTNGNGQRRIMVAKQGSPVTAVPLNGISYTANNIFGSGSALAAGEFVVYDGTGNSTYVYGLNPSTNYHFRIYEYDGTGSNTIYLTNLFAAASAATATTPTVQADNVAATNISSTSLNLSWSQGNGRARLVVIHKNTAVDIIPQDFIAYTSNSDYGNGQQIGSGNYVLSNTTDVFTIVHNLQPGTVYHFAVFEFNGYNQPLYLSPAAVFSVTTLVALPVKLSKWKVTGRDNKVALQWTTSSEINASHFNIQRSGDGINFITIDRVNATGNSQQDINYTSDDTTPLDGTSRYRLQIVDKDGKFEYSSIQSVSMHLSVKLIRLQNNPVGNDLVAVVSANGRNDGNEWSIVNVYGQVLKNGVSVANRIAVNTSAFPAGNYWLLVKINEQVHAVQFAR